ncbi:hypothetical protein [Cephaloticoccus capnophilus]|uniref:hypothetical protein n=1 Tax=Cephaloticoccus capnophilus TaxID=1548208 RepID=UPI0012E72D20|nr:hypothetical protein [Cephaloticoccus capnophilus]
MKIKFIIAAFVGLVGFITAQGEIVNIPDSNFKAYLVGNPEINTNGDGEISVAEAQAFTGTINCSSRGISDLTGIEAFVNITGLDCNFNELTSLDLRRNTDLLKLNCRNNKMNILDIRGNTALVHLDCRVNKLAILNLRNNTALKILSCGSNELTSLDLSKNTALEKLYCEYNYKLTSLDLSRNRALERLHCDEHLQGSLDLRNHTELLDLRYASKYIRP